MFIYPRSYSDDIVPVVLPFFAGIVPLSTQQSYLCQRHLLKNYHRQYLNKRL